MKLSSCEAGIGNANGQRSLRDLLPYSPMSWQCGDKCKKQNESAHAENYPASAEAMTGQTESITTPHGGNYLACIALSIRCANCAISLQPRSITKKNTTGITSY